MAGKFSNTLKVSLKQHLAMQLQHLETDSRVLNWQTMLRSWNKESKLVFVILLMNHFYMVLHKIRDIDTFHDHWIDTRDIEIWPPQPHLTSNSSANTASISSSSSSSSSSASSSACEIRSLTWTAMSEWKKTMGFHSNDVGKIAKMMYSKE